MLELRDKNERTWLMCPRKYELHYIRGLAPTFRPVALAFGTAFHAAVACHFLGIKEGGVPPPLEVLAQAFRDSWQVQLDDKVPLQIDEDEDPGSLIDLGIRMLSAFRAHEADKHPEVIASEHAFAGDTRGTPASARCSYSEG
jgi:hypothetical protein